MTFAKPYSKEHPEEIAIRDPDKALTWADVDDVLNRCANGLQAMDLGPEIRIAVFAENYVETALANLGGLVAGTSVVPVNFHLTAEEVARIKGCFTAPDYQSADTAALDAKLAEDKAFSRWFHTNTRAHKQAGYRAVTLTLKRTGRVPGDISDEQLEAVADLADQYSFGELRNSHQQNMVLSDVAANDLYDLWKALDALGFATPNLGLLTDIVACPGGDLCALANAKSIPIAESIQRRFDDVDYVHDLGPLDLNISGCMNACGHHHIGHIGILGVDKKGKEFYQVTLGGRGDKLSRVGEKMGPSFESEEITDVVEKIIKLYVEKRLENEPFIDTYERIGMDPFKERIYG